MNSKERTLQPHLPGGGSIDFEAVFADSGIGIGLVALDGRWLRVNRRLCEVTGYAERDLLATNFQDITHPRDLDVDLEFVRQLLAGDIDTFEMEKRYRHRDGHYFWVQLNVSLIRDARGEAQYFVSQVQDITARKELEAGLSVARAQWEKAQRGGAHGVWDWNLETDEVFFSREWKALIGYAEHEIGDSPAEWETRVHPDDLKHCLADLDSHLRGETETFSNEHRIRCKDGGYKWVHDRGRVVARDARGTPTRMIGTLAEASWRKQFVSVPQDSPRERELHDALTGLPQRLLMEDRIERAAALARREKTLCGVLFVAIDGLEAVGERHGFHAADHVLRTVTDRLRAVLRESDSIGRIGDDELLVLLQHVADRDDIALPAQRLLDEIERPVEWQRLMLTTRGVIGAALAPLHSNDPGVLISIAERAMHDARDKANRLHIFDNG